VRELAVGDEIGGYRIEEIAGRGGMGLVYRARQRRPDRTVAIKVIVPELAADPAFRARFEQESTTAAEIEHPNVIPVYEVGDEDGLLYIAMRFVQGIDLGGLLTLHGTLKPRRATYLAGQVADALDAAHADGLVHRDVKPGNVLVSGSDHVYLTDFGLTKRTADTRGMTAAGMFVGSVDYVAPEQILGQHVDGRADTYSLGCVLFELLSGTVPFVRDTDVARILAQVNDPPPRLQNVPDALADAVLRAMAKDPEDRFASTGDFGRAALRAAGHTVITPGETGESEQPAASSAMAPPPRSSLPSTKAAAPAELATEVEPTVTVIVVDDHPFFRDGVTRALERTANIRVVAEADNGRDALEIIRRERPTVALVDYQMPEMDGIALLHAVIQDQLATRVVLLSAVIDSATVFRAVEEGAAGYLSKDARREDIVNGVLSAARGDTVVPPDLAGRLAAEIRLRAQTKVAGESDS
jgi:DNA-binding NarL/FixJ family response regulator